MLPVDAEVAGEGELLTPLPARLPMLGALGRQALSKLFTGRTPGLSRGISKWQEKQKDCRGGGLRGLAFLP